MTLRNRLSLLFLSFLLLVTVSAAATAWTVRDQGQAALVINLAGRQRMLVQEVLNQAVQIQAGSDSTDHRQTLRRAEAVFDQTLAALIAGGETQYLPGQAASIPATQSDEIRHELRILQRDWAAFRAGLRVIETAEPGSASLDSALQSLQALAPQLVQQADAIVRLYEAEAERKLARVQSIQTGFFLCALGLLVTGVVMIQRGIMLPLHILKRTAKQIGQGDLTSPIQIASPPEFSDLATGVDLMRAQLKALTDGLEARVNQRTRELIALYDVICEISSHLEIERVLNSVTSKARDLIESDVAFLCLLDEANKSLVLKAHHGPADAVCGTCVLVQHSVAAQVLGCGEAMICNVGGCQTIAAKYRSSHLAAPLRVGERVIGALCVGSAQAATYSREQVRLLTELANATAIALENARLYEQVERAAVLEERQRIAADMHDGLAQTLSYVKLKAGLAADLLAQESSQQAEQELSLISEAMDRAGDEVRQSIAALRAIPALDRALQAHLAEAVTVFAEATPEIAIKWVSAIDQEIVLENDLTAQVLRVVQEALQNTRRHARANQIIVELERQGQDYRVMIQDDGCGFDPACMNGAGHFGLNIMQARAARIYGNLTIASAPGEGTRVILSWPVQPPLPA